VTVAISKVAVEHTKIVIQFVASKQIKARVYLRDALTEQSQIAFLGSGEQLRYPQVVGIELCRLPVTGCVVPLEANDLNKYSYIEPDEFTAFGFTYQANSPVSENDTISFSVAMIARYATPSGDPSQAGPPKPIRFNFPYIQLSHH
jgi:hypothetical protein